jgi:2'-5' RNA ligase
MIDIRAASVLRFVFHRFAPGTLDMKRTAIVYWLLPAKPERDLFCEFVRILRKGFRAPNFEPHLTLFVSAKDRQSPKEVLRALRSRPIRLNVYGVAYSANFTKTLFVRFKSSPALRKIVTDISHAANSSTKPLTDPHVSLLYKKIPPGVKKELAAVIKLPFRNAVFDSIAAVRLSLPVRTGADVAKWKIIARKSLRP